MKFSSIPALGYYLACQSYLNGIANAEEPTPLTRDDAIGERDIGSGPLKPVLCNGYSVEPSAINQAMTQGVNAVTNNFPGGKNNYPHEFRNNGNPPFTFPNCPDPGDASGSGPLYEYPVLRVGQNPWVPGKNTKLDSKANPDRVIFEASAGGYCGMITHDGASAPGQFIQCI